MTALSPTRLTRNYNGPDSFTYTVTDETSRPHVHGLAGLLFGGGHTNPQAATVSINVKPVDDQGTAAPDTATVDEDDSVDITDTELLANVHDIDGGLHITGVGNATHGTVVRDDVTGVTTYTPEADYNGDASFEYTATDQHGGTTTGVVNITVNPVDDQGTADPDTATVDEDDSVDITDTELLANVDDIDADSTSPP